MREILFRGKVLPAGGWIFGTSIHMKQKAKHDAALAEQHRRDVVAYGLYDRRTRAVIRANKKKYK